MGFHAVDAFLNPAMAVPALLKLVITAVSADASVTTQTPKISQMNSTDLFVNWNGLTVAGQYNLTATYNGSIVPIDGGGLFSVWANATVSAARTLVYGPGAGAVPTAANGSVTVVAGQSNSIYLLARDAFGNTITGPAVLFQLSPAFSPSWSSVNVTVGSMGVTTITYALMISDVFQLTVRTMLQQVVFQSVVTVTPAQVFPMASLLTVLPSAYAGGVSALSALVMDAYGNEVISLAGTEVYAMIAGCGSTATAAAAQVVGMSYDIASGLYRGSAVVTTTGCSSARAYVHQYPLGSAASSWTVAAGPLDLSTTTLTGNTAVALGGKVQLVILPRDSYGNAAAEAGVADLVTRVVLSPPCASCVVTTGTVASGNLLDAPAVFITMTTAGTYSCSVTLASGSQSNTLVLAGILVAAPPSPSRAVTLPPPSPLPSSSLNSSSPPPAGAVPLALTTSPSTKQSTWVAIVASVSAVGALIIALLVWWGCRQRRRDMDGGSDSEAREEHKQQRRSLTAMDSVQAMEDNNQAVDVMVVTNGSPVAPRRLPALVQPKRSHDGRPGRMSSDGSVHPNPLSAERSDFNHRSGLSPSASRGATLAADPEAFLDTAFRNPLAGRIDSLPCGFHAPLPLREPSNSGREQDAYGESRSPSSALTRAPSSALGSPRK